MSVKLNIKAKSLDDLGLELRTKRKPRKSRYVSTNIQNIQNLRTPYNLNSFGIRGIPTETINQNNIPTIYSSIALENLKALENLNQNNKLKLLKNDDNNDIKEYINTGLNNVIAGGKSLGNNLYNEIMKNRQMIDNFNTKKTFIPSGNSTSAGVTLDGRAGVLPFLFDDDDYEEEEEEEERELQYSICIIDDFADALKDIDIQKQLSKMLIKSRHLCCAFVFTLQSYFYIPKILRKQITNITIFKPKNAEEWNTIAKELLNLNQDDGLILYNYVFNEPYSHLDIDTLTNELFKNFNKLEIEN